VRRVVTWSVFLLVGGIAAVAIAAAIVNGDSSRATVDGDTTEVSPCDSGQLELSIRASGFGAHIAALRLSGSEPCDVGDLPIRATVVDRNGRHSSTTVGPPQEFTGQIDPGEELVATFDYTTRCRQKGPFSATLIAEGEDGSLEATAPISFRRDPFTTPACKAR